MGDEFVVTTLVEADFRDVQQVEVAANTRFLSFGLPDVAHMPPLSTTELCSIIARGVGYVARTPRGDFPLRSGSVSHDSSTNFSELMGFVAATHSETEAHVEQISVHPLAAGHGLGRQLVELVDSWAQSRGLATLTLTTFRDVPWNGPWYKELGFVEPDYDAISLGLRRRLGETQRAAWARGAARIAMTRPVRRRDATSGSS